MIRVLFVDDEPDVLEGLENRLRPLRGEWSMRFVCGATAALNLCAQQPFDVVVSDMRMPVIDGPELFRRLRTGYPGTIRIALSGQTSEESVLRTLPLAHQFLSKPSSADELRASITSALRMKELLNDPGLEKMIRGVGRLPPAPKVYSQLTELLERKEPSLTAIAELLEQDPSITARLLQLVNSAYFGLTRKLSSVRETVQYLGLSAVRGVVLSVELFDWVGQSKLVEPYSLVRFHEHVMCVANLASQLVSGDEERRLAFTGAVIHDFGTLVLAMADRVTLDEIFARANQPGIDPVAAERERFGFSHAEVGARLFSLWGLPHSLVEIVAHHHSPSLSSHTRWSALGAVHVADALLAQNEPTVSPMCMPSTLDREYVERMGCGHLLPQWEELARAQVLPPQEQS